ncbi:LarC family nickel insertion protein [Prochlorococcus sp. MIT 1300]|uniref:LarC family nickel insertion protein n=1 Tax=Prochlorococcus sp. MIT 1300 TaxID=3096218 RepID=UPI002A7493AC|nr:LarC family nickel insertion protein [Prochlorococcus sp. MIT 1300]
MAVLYFDCASGLAGDMLLGALLDLGVPLNAIEEPLRAIGLGNTFSINAGESSSFGMRGLRVSVQELETPPPCRHWRDIKKMIAEATWSKDLRNNVLRVFELLAEAEAFVHGNSVEEVHFHEIGAIDSLVDVVGVCAAIEYLAPARVLSAVPPAGSGNVETSHGILPVPVPAVLELARRNGIRLMSDPQSSLGELTTPTGLALMAILAESFGLPSSFGIQRIGIGLGHRNFNRPNLLRVYELDDLSLTPVDGEKVGLSWQPLVVQEAWIDDSTPEDLTIFIDQLKKAGAIDVACHPIQMKKSRIGISVTALVKPEDASSLRLIWLSRGLTIGLRERFNGRWALPRRIGFCPTSFGNIKVKQTRRPDGQLTIKPEHSELLRISKECSCSIDDIKLEIFENANHFAAEGEWEF